MSNPQCAHGERTFREGDGPKGHWGAWFCPTPKGTQDQCSPEWVKQSRGTKEQPAPTTNAATALLEAIDAKLERIVQLLSEQSTKDIPF